MNKNKLNSYRSVTLALLLTTAISTAQATPLVEPTFQEIERDRLIDRDGGDEGTPPDDDDGRQDGGDEDERQDDGDNTGPPDTSDSCKLMDCGDDFPPIPEDTDGIPLDGSTF